MSNTYKNHSQKNTSVNHHKKEDFGLINKVNINDELKKELGKHDINVDKWYHKLLTGQYFKETGVFFHDDVILKRLAIEYQKSLYNRTIESMVLIKNELFNHLPEQVWIHMYLTGQIYDHNGKQLNKSNQDIEKLSNEYSIVYNRAKSVNI
jgi:hypothetical protein